MVIKFKSCTLAFQSFYHLTFPWSVPLPTLIVWFQYPIQQPNWPIFLGHPISRSQPKLFPSTAYPCPPSSISKCPNPAHLWKVNSNTDLYDIIPDSLCRSDFASLLTHVTSCQLFLDLITYYHVLLLSALMTASSWESQILEGRGCVLSIIPSTGLTLGLATGFHLCGLDKSGPYSETWFTLQ